MQTSKKEEGITWLDISELCAEFAEEREKNCFSKATGVILKSAPSKGGNTHPDSTGKVIGNCPTTVFN